MDFRKLFFFDLHLFPASLSFKQRVLSGFGLGVLASLLVFSLLSTLNAPSSLSPSSSFSSSSVFSWFLSTPNAISPSNSGLGMTHSANATADPKNSSGLQISDMDSSTSCFSGEESDLGIARFENSSTTVDNQSPILDRNQQLFESARSSCNRRNDSVKCDIFDGRWVRDERDAPFYPAGSCPYIDTDFNCHKNGRPDDEFLRWRWQPNACDIPRLNGTDFLARLKGKRLLFVGDSLNRNMWESLVCILRHSVKNKDTVYEASGRHEFRTSGYYSFRFEDYNCSVDFVRSPFLVREINFKNANGSDDERLKLDVLDETTSAYRSADVLVFNTGHWWTHEKTSRGIDYYQEGDYVYPVLKVLKAYKKALTTWARWVDKNIDSRKTQVVFRGYSLTHFRGGQWNSGGQCHKETEPIFNETFLVKYPAKMRALERVLEQMKTPVIYLNISRLTDYRKDGHPSIYRKTYDTVEEQIAAETAQDCSHWCLPGIPDTWNELLYASLLINGNESWML